MGDTLDRLGIFCTGGVISSYIWLRCPDGLKSWDFSIFCRKRRRWRAHRKRRGFFRLTAFNAHKKTAEAMQRFEMLARGL